MTREPDRYEAKARELWVKELLFARPEKDAIAVIAAALRLEREDALNEAAQLVESYRSINATGFMGSRIRALASRAAAPAQSAQERCPTCGRPESGERTDMPNPAFCWSRLLREGDSAFVDERCHRPIAVPAAAPAAEPERFFPGAAEAMGEPPSEPVAPAPYTAPVTSRETEMRGEETRMEKLLRETGVRVLIEPCEAGGHYRNENGATFHPSKCRAGGGEE